jgi:hypothetical protein
VAVKVWVTPPVARLAVGGATSTAIFGGVTVIIAAADLVESAIEVAVRVTAPPGTDAGPV